MFLFQVNLKGHYVDLEQNLHSISTYNINEVIIQTHNWNDKLFSEENKVLRTLSEAREMAGSAKYKQSKTVWNCVVL